MVSTRALDSSGIDWDPAAIFQHLAILKNIVTSEIKCFDVPWSCMDLFKAPRCVDNVPKATWRDDVMTLRLDDFHGF